MKAGVKSTEFYMALLAQALGVGVTFGLLTTPDVTTILASTTNTVEAISALLVALTPLFGGLAVLWKYISARTDLKIEFEKIQAGLGFDLPVAASTRKK